MVATVPPQTGHQHFSSNRWTPLSLTAAVVFADFDSQPEYNGWSEYDDPLDEDEEDTTTTVTEEPAQRGPTNPEERFLRRAIHSTGIDALYGNDTIHSKWLSTKYNISIGKDAEKKDLEKQPGVLGISDQGHSGRCWIFANLNLLRIPMLKEYGDDFSYSATAISYWDRLERSELFLDNMIRAKDSDPDDEKVRDILRYGIIEGGDFELFRNIVEKYGLLPRCVMPETKLSKKSSDYTHLLQRKLCEWGGVLHTMARKGASDAEIQKFKSRCMDQVRTLLDRAIGTPPSTFLWKHDGKDGKDGIVTRMTPLQFYHANPIKLKKWVHLTCIPYLPTGDRITVPGLTNMAGGETFSTINCDVSDLLAAVEQSIRNNSPVLCGTDVRQLNWEKQFFASDANEIEALFGVGPLHGSSMLTKSNRMKYRVGGLQSHLMLFVGCDSKVSTPTPNLSPVAPEPLPEQFGPLFKVQNSWAKVPTAFMSLRWVEDFLFSITLDPAFAPPSIQLLLAEAAKSNSTVKVHVLEPHQLYPWVGF